MSKLLLMLLTILMAQVLNIDTSTGYDTIIQTGVKGNTQVSIDMLYSDKLKAVLFPFDQDKRTTSTDSNVLNMNVYNNTSTVLSVSYVQDTCLRDYPLVYTFRELKSNEPETAYLGMLTNYVTGFRNTTNPCGIVNVNLYILKVSRDLTFSYAKEWTNIDILGLVGQRKCIGCDYYKIMSMTVYKEKLVGLFMFTKIADPSKKIFLIAVFNHNKSQVEQIYIYDLDLSYVKSIDIYPDTCLLYFLYPDIESKKYQLVILDLSNYYIFENPGAFVDLNIKDLPTIKPTDLILDAQYRVFMLANEYSTSLVNGVIFSNVFLYNFNLDNSLLRINIENINYISVRKSISTEDTVSTTLWKNPFLVFCLTNYCHSVKINNFPFLVNSSNLSIWKSIALTSRSNSLVEKTIVTDLKDVSNDDATTKLMFSAFTIEQGNSNYKTIIGSMSLDSCLFYKTNLDNRCREQCYSSEVTSDSEQQCITLTCPNNIMRRSGCVNSCTGTDVTLTLGQNNYCIDYCPFGYYLNIGSCVRNCPVNTFTDYDNRKCLQICPRNSFVYKNYCLSSCFTGIVDDTVTPPVCLDKCPDSTYLIKGPSYSKCVTNCPYDYIINPSNSKECIKCTSTNLVCTNLCPQYFVINQLSSVNTECINCKLLNKYYYLGQCIDIPPNIAYNLFPDYNAIVDCQTLGLYIYNGLCVASCPATYYPYDKTYECKRLQQTGLYLTTSGFLSDSCPDGTGTDANNICYDCTAKGMYVYNNLCVISCPFFFFKESSTCTPCNNLMSNDSNYYQSCVLCEDGGYISNNRCIKCAADEFIFNFSTCVKACGYNSKVDFVNRTCDPCFKYGLFLYNNKCVAQCPENTKQNPMTSICEFIGNNCGALNCNSGRCKMADPNVPYCECPAGFTGQYCELTASYLSSFTTTMRDNFNNSLVTDEFINEAYYNITYAYAANKTAVLDENINNILDEVFMIYDTYADYLKSNSTRFAENIFQLTDFILALLKGQNEKEYFAAELIDKLSNVMDNSVLQLVQQNSNFQNLNPNLKVSIDDISNYNNYAENSISNRMSYVNMSSCEQTIRTKLNLSPTDPLLVKRIEYTETNKTQTAADTTSTKIEYAIYDSDGNKLDIQSICGNQPFEVLFPLNDTRIDVERYNKYIVKGVNIYDANDPFFNTICYPFADPDNAVGDTTPTSRRQQLLEVIQCDDGCSFAGINPITKYATCNCVNVSSSGQTVLDAVEKGFLNFNNLALFQCWEFVIGKKASFTNLGYYIMIGTFCCTILSIIICYYIDKCRRKKYKSYFKHDGQIYYPELFDLEEYLLFLFQLYDKHRQSIKELEDLKDKEFDDKVAELNKQNESVKTHTNEDDSSMLMNEKKVIETLDDKKLKEIENDHEALNRMNNLVRKATSQGKVNLNLGLIQKNSEVAIRVRKSMYKLNSFKTLRREKKFKTGKHLYNHSPHGNIREASP
jgi:hypothetical protein